MSDFDDASVFDSDPNGRPHSGPGAAHDTGKKFIWKGMTVTELTRHMAEIRAAMPSVKLEDLNVEEALLTQMHVLQELQAVVMGNEQIALNQRVQAANALSKCLQDIADRQTAIYTSERLKRIETVLIRAVRDHLDEDAAKVFLDAYERMAEEGGV